MFTKFSKNQPNIFSIYKTLTPHIHIKANGINLLLALTPSGTVQQRQTWGQKDPGFGWATFGWASCINDTFVTLV